MEIHILNGDGYRLSPRDVAFPLRLLGDEPLVVGINCGEGGGQFPAGLNLHNVSACGIEFTMALPPWMRVPESTASRSRSHARYIAEGDFLLEGQNVGVLLQVLPGGRETSCHSHPAIQEFGHPGTKEFFLPLWSTNGITPLLYTSTSPKFIPPCGCWVEVGVPHQLQALADTTTVSLIFMQPIPHVRWMKGHVPYDSPFVPYTRAGFFEGEFLERHSGRNCRGDQIC